MKDVCLSCSTFIIYDSGLSYQMTESRTALKFGLTAIVAENIDCHHIALVSKFPVTLWLQGSSQCALSYLLTIN